MEIERKYKIKNIPEDLNRYSSKKIEQGYLCNKPIVRIRRSNEDYYLTYKSKTEIPESINGAIINHEVELPLTKEAYEHLKEKTDHHMISKTRYLIPIEGNLTAELDIFEGYLAGLVFAEVEFQDVETSNQFIAPDWFDIELTSDRRYSNHFLSKLSSACELEPDS